MDDFELELKQDFINEALINLEEVEGSFMELESAADPKPLLDKIFRLAHNLKGGSRAVGFGEVAEFTHQLESLVLMIQKGEVTLATAVITTLLRSNDRLVEMLSALKSNFAATFDNAEILADIQRWMSGQAPAPAPVTAPVVPASPEPAVTQVPEASAFFAEAESAPTAEAQAVRAPDIPAAPSKPPENKNNDGAKGKEDEIIRVSLSKIDTLNDFVGELIVLQSVIQQQAGFGDPLKMQAALRQMIKLSKDIQGLSMSLRMLPVKPLVQKLQRVVRDTARALDKDVSFEVHGEQLDVDKSVLDQLADPLIHILRNAVDHGLEMPEDRERTGKSRQGKVLLSFFNEGNHLIIEVKDDGKGINGEILRKKAIEKQLISESQQLGEKQLINLIFHPGFSTKSETSEISGRGVGMDVVKTNVEKIGGQIDISTAVGSGSTFRLQIPLSLAVIDGLVVVCGHNRYVVPLSQVQETVNLRSQQVFVSKPGVGACFLLRRVVVPLISLQEAVGDRSATVTGEGTAMIINVEDCLLALVVDDIVRAQQIVIKPLGNGIVPSKGWIGSCVLGDGLPTLILSPIDLLSGRISRNIGEQRVGGAA